MMFCLPPLSADLQTQGYLFHIFVGFLSVHESSGKLHVLQSSYFKICSQSLSHRCCTDIPASSLLHWGKSETDSTRYLTFLQLLDNVPCNDLLPFLISLFHLWSVFLEYPLPHTCIHPTYTHVLFVLKLSSRDLFLGKPKLKHLLDV